MNGTTYTTPCGRYEITVEAINPSNGKDCLNEIAQNGYAVLRVRDLQIEDAFTPIEYVTDKQEIHRATVYCDTAPIS